MRVLVTGAAGYIGSHACRGLLQAGAERVVSVDSLVQGHPGATQALARMGGDRFTGARLDVRQTAPLADLMARERPTVVLHFAGLAQVGESVRHPQLYQSVNVGGTRSVLQAMESAGVRRLVLSSSAAVYGNAREQPISEDSPTNPVSPYGATKLAAESLVAKHAASTAAGPAASGAVAHAAGGAAAPFRAACLRYFNVSGAASDGTLGEDHRPETHLIPSALQVALGVRGPLQVFGTNHDTPDGTCIRDYVHVEDLIDAHLAAVRWLASERGGCAGDGSARGAFAGDGFVRAFNIGIGRGFSVREVLAACRTATGHAIAATDGQSRAGDPPELVANVERAANELGWRAQRTSLEAMVTSAWNWMRAHPRGYSPDV